MDSGHYRSQNKQASLEGVLPLRVRQDIQVEEQVYGGETFYTAKDPLTLKYYRMKELEYFIFTLLDGSREVENIQAEVEKRFGGLNVSEAQIKEFIIMLRNSNFLETFGPHGSKLLYQRTGLKRRAKLKQTLMSFFFIKIPLVDPDSFFNRTYPYLKFIWTKAFLRIWLFLLGLLFLIIISNSGEFVHQITGFFNWKNLALVWVAIMVIKTMHEIGHGLTCKHYGGEVHELGILLIVFTPWMYVNVSDTWIFQKSQQRFLVTVAGIMTELFAAALAGMVWWLTSPGVLNSLSHNIIIVCTIDNLLRNANPLLRYDGYYALSDFVEIPNLRMKAMKYMSDLMKKYLLRIPVQDMETSPRRKRIYLIYGPLTLIYLNFIVFAIAMFIGKNFFIFGLILAGSMIIRSFIMPIKKGITFAFQHRAQMGYGRPFFIGIALLPVAILIFLFFYQSPLKVTSPCSVEPMDHAVVRAETSGFLEKLLCDQGDLVKKDQVLGILKNQKLLTEYEKLRIERTTLIQMKRKALALNKYVDYDQTELEIAKTGKEIEKLKEKMDKLKLLSPGDGTILTPDLKEKIGDFLGEGEIFCETGYLENIQVRIIIPEENFPEIRKGQPIDLKVYSYPGKTFQGKVLDISPVKIENLENLALSSKFGGLLPTETVTKTEEAPKLPYFQVTMEIDNSQFMLRPGMTGFSKIYCERRSLIVILWHKILRLIKPERLMIFR